MNLGRKAPGLIDLLKKHVPTLRNSACDCPKAAKHCLEPEAACPQDESIGPEGACVLVGRKFAKALSSPPPGRTRTEGIGEMISWRLVVPAVLVAAAVAACLTYFIIPPPTVEAVWGLPPTSPIIKGTDRATRTNINQHSSAEEEAKAAFERAAAAILRQAPELQASVRVYEPPTAEHIPLPKKRPLPRP